MDLLTAYIPLDRCRAIAGGETLPERTSGAAMFADISGFTPLTEALVRELGSRRAAEELTRNLNLVYGALIDEIHRCGGSVVSFAGDAITCWFDDADPSGFPKPEGSVRAAACGLTMQRVMARFAAIETPSGGRVPLAIKVSISAGPARRFLVGDPAIQVIDVLAGRTLDRVAHAGKLTGRGEVVVDEQIAERWGQVREWRQDPADTSLPQSGTGPLVVPGYDGGERFAVIGQAEHPLSPGSIESIQAPQLTQAQARSWVLPPIYEQLETGQARFLAELRPAVALFLKFGGLDYDGDDAVQHKLDTYIRWVQNVLLRYDSYLFQLITGDKGSYLYAAFGAPRAHDDDAARAVSAAAELHALPADLRRSIAGIQIGICQGAMRAGDYGGPARRTYGVLGDEVTLAARLMEAAAPGRMLVSQRVADAAARDYRFEYVDTIPLKGKRQPMQVFRPLERRREPLQAATQAFTILLTGRDAELAQMRQALAQAMAGQGQIVRLEGTAGVGKSHLAATFAQEARDRGLQVVTGACQSAGQGEPYAAWRAILRALFNMAEEPSSLERMSEVMAWINGQVKHVQTVIDHLNPDWLTRLPLLGDLLQLPIADNPTTAVLDPQMRQQWLFTLLAELVQTWAQSKPLFLLIEDAQWMDEASLRLTLNLAWALAQTPALLLLTHRADAPLLPDLNRLPYHHHLVLGELAPEGIATLVSGRLQGVPSTLALSFIQARVQGNPFFARELVDALRESGGLVQEEGIWTLSRPVFDALRQARCLLKRNGGWVLAPDAELSAALASIPGVDIPDSIHNTILSRLDRLVEAPKLTLKVASVIGRAAGLNLLSQAHPVHPDMPALLEQVKELETRSFVRQEISPQGALSCAFRNNLTQEVTYSTLLSEQRCELHGAVGEAMERLQPDAVDPLAYHYGRSDVRDKAMVYLDKAARKAQQEYANEIALHNYSQALKLEDRWEWRKGQVETLHILGRREEELAALKGLAAHPQAPVEETAYLWGQYYETIGEFKKAQAAINRAAKACWERGDEIGQARCLAQAGLVARRQGDYKRARRWYEQALVLFKDRKACQGEQARVLAQTLSGLGAVHRQTGQFEWARACYQEALSLSQACGSRLGQAEALNHLGGVYYYQRRLADARDHYQQALEIRREIGDRAGEGVGLLNLAQVHFDLGDYARAEQDYRQALAIQQAIGNRWEEVNDWLGLGAVHLELGDLAQAQTCFQQGLQIAQSIGDQGGQAYALVNLGLALRDAGRYAVAHKALVEGLKLAEAQEDRYLISSYHSYLGEVYLCLGQPDLAEQAVQASLAIRRALDMRPRMADDWATLAAIYLAGERVGEAVSCAGEALSILQESGGEGVEFASRDYFICGQALSAHGQTQSAQAALRAAYELVMARADKIVDPALRRSFLERVAVNRQIVEEARRLGSP